MPLDFSEIVTKLIWDARNQETRAEKLESELSVARLAVKNAENARQKCLNREYKRIHRLLSFGCRDCGADGEILCSYCVQPLCNACLEEDTGQSIRHEDGPIEALTNSYICSICNER